MISTFAAKQLKKCMEDMLVYRTEVSVEVYMEILRGFDFRLNLNYSVLFEGMFGA